MKRVLSFLFLAAFIVSGEVKFPLVYNNKPIVFHPKGIHVWNGRIYVSDRRHYNIKVFSNTGKFLFKFGDKGEGPGLFKRWFGVFTVSPDGLVLQGDYWGGNRFLNVFDGNGKFLHTLPIKLNTPFGVEDIHAGNNGRIVLGLSYGFHTNKREGIVFIGSYYEFFIMKKDGSLKRIEKGLVYHSFSYAENGPNFTIPYQIYYLSAYYPAMDLLAICKNDESKIQLISLKSMLSVIMNAGWKKERVTRKDLGEKIKFWTEASWMRPEGKKLYKKLSPSNLPDPYVPIIADIQFTPEGNLIVSRASEWKHIKIRKFNLKGKLLSEFEDVGYPFAITGSKVYLLDCSSDETCYVIVRDRTGKY